jgi:PAS domain S-box-containing protein
MSNDPPNNRTEAIQEPQASPFDGPGELRALCRSIDWSATPLGPVALWSPGLRLAVRLCLECRTPTALWIGPDYRLIHNEAYAAALVEKYPSAMGRPMHEVWPEVRDEIAGDFDRVLHKGESIRHDEARYRLIRDGQETEAYFAYSLTPLRDVSGNIIGVFNVMEETTPLVRARTERERRYQALFEHIDEALCIVEPILDAQGTPFDYRFLETNTAFVRDTGHGNAVGKTARELDRGLASLWPEIVYGVANTGDPVRVDGRFKDLDRWLEVFAFKAEEDDRSSRVGMLFRDISQRKKVEEDLRASEARHAFLVRLADALRPLSDPLDVQKAAARVLREHLRATRVAYVEVVGDDYVASHDYVTSAPHVTGRYPMATFGHRLLKEYRAGRTALSGDTQSDPALSPEERQAFAAVQIRAYIGVPLVKNGQLVAVMAVHASEARAWTADEATLAEETAERTWAAVERAHAESELRESEARLRRLWDSGMLGVVFFNIPAGSITDANDKFLEMVGYAREDLRAGLVSWVQMTPEEYRAVDEQAIAELRATGVDTPYEKEFIRKDGLRVPIYVGAATFDPEKNHGIAFILDISKAKELERALRQANQQLIEADRRKNHFIAVLSHELRNPLMPIKNGLYILDRAAPGGDQARRAKEVIERQVDQLSHLVDDLLDVTRITRGKVQLHRCRLELTQLVRRTVDDHRALFQDADVRLEVEPAALPVFVDADWNRTAQVLSNLLQNAAKFTPRGGLVKVTLARDIDARQVVIRVADTGLGMTPELLAQLFEPFMQADETLDRSKGGLGLGLALAKGLVEQHGGSIEASSRGLDCGSEFIVRLPLDLSDPEAVEQAPEPAAAARHRVLIIEDNVDAAQSLKELLELQGHEVSVAHDGYDGLAKARELRADLVLCDIGLPGMDGYEVARAFRADDALRGAHLIALSGYALPEDLQRAAEAGFDRHVAKPLTLGKLEQLLGK